MGTIKELLLTFLLNSLWQAALVACAALLCARILRGAPGETPDSADA